MSTFYVEHGMVTVTFTLTEDLCTWDAPQPPLTDDDREQIQERLQTGKWPAGKRFSTGLPEKK